MGHRKYSGISLPAPAGLARPQIRLGAPRCATGARRKGLGVQGGVRGGGHRGGRRGAAGQCARCEAWRAGRQGRGASAAPAEGEAWGGGQGERGEPVRDGRAPSSSSGTPIGGGQLLAVPPLVDDVDASTSICFPGPRLRGHVSHTSCPPRLAWKRLPGCMPCGTVTAYFCTLLGRTGICTWSVEFGPLP